MKFIDFNCFYDFGWELYFKLLKIKQFSLFEFWFHHSAFLDFRPNINLDVRMLNNEVLAITFKCFNISMGVILFNFYSYDY